MSKEKNLKKAYEDAMKIAEDSLFEILVENSKKFWKKMKAVEKKKEESDPKAEKFSEIIKKMGLCPSGRNAVAELVTEITGVKGIDVSGEKGKRIEFEKGTVVFIKGNPNSHNYGIGPVFITSTAISGHISKDTSKGNCLPDELQYYREPTEGEIKELCKARANEILREMF